MQGQGASTALLHTFQSSTPACRAKLIQPLRVRGYDRPMHSGIQGMHASEKDSLASLMHSQDLMLQLVAVGWQASLSSTSRELPSGQERGSQSTPTSPAAARLPSAAWAVNLHRSQQAVHSTGCALGC